MSKDENFLERLKKIIPNHIKPKFNNDQDLLKWNKKEGKIFSKLIIKKNQEMKMKCIIKKSGIKELYINCSFDNYKIEHEGHRKVVESTRQYAKEFDKNVCSFIFSGRPGTGKNHLASAIGNYLILNGKNVLIMTVSDLMSNVKETFNKTKNNITETKLLNQLSKIDLLIIDEIGMQIESRYEKIIINQIINKRSSSNKSTGMLSNLNYRQMKNLLGERVMDRMCIGNSLFLNFQWNSYRKNIN